MPMVGKGLIHPRGDHFSSEHLSASFHLSHVRDVFEEGCHVGPVRASEMSLSLWPNECFRAVLIRDAALKQHPKGYWRRGTTVFMLESCLVWG